MHPQFTPKDTARFWPKVDKSGECWIWTAGTNGRYGTFSINRKNLYAHIFSYILHNGDFASDLNVCHACDNPLCVRPEHLFTGTQADNIKDCRNKGRLACGEKHGLKKHPGRAASGNRNGSKTHPERYPRGEQRTDSKLKEEQVLQIRMEYFTGKVSQSELARQYGINQASIFAIVHRKTWKHI